MNIAVLGSNGFVGQAVSKKLSENHVITNINKHNYKDFLGHYFDIFVNCNGNSRKFWANNNIKEDFVLSVQSVYNSLFDFKFNVYIYISSMDVYAHNPYGYHKMLSENLIQDKTSNYVFFRCSSIIGKNMKKGVVKDILEDKPVFVSSDSRIELITDTDVGRVVDEVISKGIVSDIINVGSTTTITVEEIAYFFNKKIKFSDNLVLQMFDYKVDNRFNFKTALEYLNELL